MKKENIDTSSLAHTKWNCKCHIVFAPIDPVSRAAIRKNRVKYAKRYPPPSAPDNDAEGIFS